MQIKIDHMTRIEGHATLETFRDQARFAVTEAPRFFEALVQGHDFGQVAHIASRICGICAVSHSCASLKATEKAIGVILSPQTELLRRIAFYGEILSSHALHIYFLAGPDFLNVSSAFELANSDPEAVKRGIRLKELGYAMCDIIVGRHTHPVAMRVGGFTFVHSRNDLDDFKKQLEQGLEDLQATIPLFAGRFPEMERETEYVSLTHPDQYAFYGGDLYSSEGRTVPVDEYREQIMERVVPYSTAKYARWNRDTYMVGALARYNNNYSRLSPEAKRAAEELDLGHPCRNPFMITAAQIVECFHCVEDGIALIDRLLDDGTESDVDQNAETAEITPRSGRGVGAVEAPRGTLFHEYEYDGRGKCKFANMVIPTAQNLGNLEADLNALLPTLEGRDEEQIARMLEMLARAYDPCISCSTH